MLCATSFTIVLVLGGGPAATTLEVAIYQSLRFDFDPSRAIALSVLQIALTAMVLAALAMVRRPEEGMVTLGGASPRFDGKTSGKRIWDIALIVIAVVFLLLPLIAIISAGLKADLVGLVTSSAFARAAATSLTIALASGSLALTLSMAIIGGRIAVDETPGSRAGAAAYGRVLGATSSLVLLVPPIVLGTGWFLLLRPWGDASRFAPILVVAINALMALPFAVRILEPAIQNHRARTARLTASLGISGPWKLWHIDWPVLLKPAALALSFAMALSLGDLGAVALFGSSDFVTLPWLLYSRLSSYRTADADGLALILGAICLILAVFGTSGHDGDRSKRAAD
jgi:thiamine transport system permease protein